LHGHNYSAHITCIGNLDTVGRVIDFSVIKDKIGNWIDRNWDHGLILNVNDTQTREAMESLLKAGLPIKLFYMDQNPTAESMCQFLFELSNTLLASYDIEVTKIVLYETDNCYATYEAHN